MIIVKLIGGLGNQLFQYAIGRRLSLLHNTPLKLDCSWFIQQEKRKYKLNHFSIIENIATETEIEPFLKNSRRRFPRFHRLLSFNKPYYQQNYINEKSVDFDPNIFKSPENIYLEGYWQSEKYFKEIAPILKNEIVVKSHPDEFNKKILNLMDREKNPVCIHIRRGDYATNPETKKYHGVLPIGYYLSGIELIRKKIPDPHFFIFSDDPEVVREQLEFEGPVTYVMHNAPEQDYEDFRLMCNCRHFIIANSSFSWWAAYLSKNQNKTIIAPATWFTGIDYNPGDRIPPDWIQL